MPISTARAQRRKAVRRRTWRKPILHLEQILAWADEHHALTGFWPTAKSGRVRTSLEEYWRAIDDALRKGARGLRAGYSLARLLARRRGVRNRKALARLTITQILRWTDAYYARHGNWPTAESGVIEGAPGETWSLINSALERGWRGLPYRTTLAKLLADKRGARNIACLPPLLIEQILAWGDAHFKRTHCWPTCNSGSIAEAPYGESWRTVELALRRCRRGIRRPTSLAQLWRKHRGVRKRPHGRIVTEREILEWADAFYLHHGHWPRLGSGAVTEAPDISWTSLHCALRDGGRGLPGGSSLAQFLFKHRGARSTGFAPAVGMSQILAWADAHFHRHGKWPSCASGRVEDCPEESWGGIQQALVCGYRGLPGGLTLARFLDEQRAELRQPAARQRRDTFVASGPDTHGQPVAGAGCSTSLVTGIGAAAGRRRNQRRTTSVRASVTREIP